MPCAARASVGGICYHVINRGNGRRPVFLKDGDYHAFLKAMAHAAIEVPMRVLRYCLMPNHFYLAHWPGKDGDLSRWMHWLLTSTRFTLSPMGETLVSTNDQGGISRNLFDLAGQLLQSPDPIGNLVQNTYNARGWIMALRQRAI
jgi:REP element-mobilizing transposase RayT